MCNDTAKQRADLPPKIQQYKTIVDKSRHKKSINNAGEKNKGLKKKPAG